MQNLPPKFERWPPAIDAETPPWRTPGWVESIKRGCLGRCPCCNDSPIFDGYLKVHDKCAHCAAPLGDMPADDAPPYIAMLVVLQILGIVLALIYQGHFRPGIILSGVLLVLLALTCMVALRMAKGAVISILLKLGMRRVRAA